MIRVFIKPERNNHNWKQANPLSKTNIMIYNDKGTYSTQPLSKHFHSVWRLLLSPGPLLLFLCLFSTQTLSAESITLQLKWMHQFQFAGYYAALEKGYYQDAGLDVRIVETQDYRSTIDRMLEGEADYAVSGSDVLIHRVKGGPVVALATVFQHSPYALLVRADSGIQRIEDLAGKRIMIGKGYQDAALQASLRRAGLYDGSYTRLKTSFNPESLINGETDAFNAYLTDQGFTLQQAGVEPLYLLPKNYDVDFYGDVLSTTESELKNNPERVHNFLQASLNGWTYALEHEDEIIDLILEKYNTQNFTRDHLEYEARASRELIQPLLVKIGYMNPERWKHIQGVFAELGFIASDSNYSGMLYNDRDNRLDLAEWLVDNWMLLTILLVSTRALLLLLLMAQMRRIIRYRTNELRASEQRYKTIFEAAPEGMWLIGPDKKTLEINSRLSTMLGYTVAEMYGKTPMDFVDDENRHIFIEQTSRIATTERRSYEISLRHKKGFNIPTLFSSVTLRNRDGSVMAALAFITDITQQLDLLEEIKQQKDYLDHLAHHDSLTNLPNRILFTDRLEQSIHKSHRTQEHIALFFVDVDRFKEINDSLGHAFGDKILREVSTRFSACIREDDTVARLGGDEFTLIMESVNDVQHTATMAQKLIKCLEQPFHIDNQQLFITASIGISIYPEDGNDAETLLRNADAAMYKAKREGRNTFQYYTKDMTDRAFQRVSMETALRHGIENQEFALNYQPQFDLATGQIIGIEALIRWLHPVRGTVSPMQFIPVAEDTGLIIPLGDWILHEASRQIREWHEAGLTDVRVAVNISGKQLRHNQLLDTIESILSRTGCNPEWLELEITEGFIMEHADQSISLLKEIRKIGIELAIDDFGTGYSSLAYLKQLPLNKLKIDKSFVRDIPADADDMAITRAVIALGKSLNLTVIAEGVETETQKSFLENEGCHQVQGYLYSKPLGAVQTTQFLKEYQLRKAITV